MKKKLYDTIQETLQKGWTDVSSTLNHFEEEAARRLRQTRELVDPRQASDEIQRVLTDFGKRMQESSENLEQRMEDSVRLVVSRVKDPLVEELSLLKNRIEKLSVRIESQHRRRSGTSDTSGTSPQDSGEDG